MPDLPRCNAEIKVGILGASMRCKLPAGHEGKHIGVAFTAWNTPEPIQRPHTPGADDL